MAEPVITLSRAMLEDGASAFATALAGELTARLGRTLSFGAATFHEVGVVDLVAGDTALVLQTLRCGDDPPGPLHVLLPKAAALTIAALERRLADDALQAARDGALDADASSALAQVMESVSDVLRRSFATAELPLLTIDPAKEVPAPQSDPTWIDDSIYLRMSLPLELEGFEASRFDLVFVRSRLAAGTGPPRESVCFVSVGDAERKRIAELEAGLGWAVLTVEPRELAKAFDERVLDASVLVVPWDLAGRAGIELTESLARDPRLSRVTLLIGIARPTRPQLLASLRAGAHGVVSHPYDAHEIRSCVESTRAPGVAA